MSTSSKTVEGGFPDDEEMKEVIVNGVAIKSSSTGETRGSRSKYESADRGGKRRQRRPSQRHPSSFRGVGDNQYQQQQQMYRDMEFLSSFEAHLNEYDETMYYTVKDYLQRHTLYYKQQTRKAANVLKDGGGGDLPKRYEILTIWYVPLATKLGIQYFILMVLLVAATIAQLVAESWPEYNPTVKPEYKTAWLAVELPIAVAFTVDVIAHFVLLPSVPNDFTVHSRRTFFRELDNWMDILSILPTYISLLSASLPSDSGSESFDFLRVLRVLRLTKVLRQFNSVDDLAYTLERSFEPLLGPFLFLFGAVVTLSTIMYYAERGEYDPVEGYSLIDDCDCLMSAPRALDPSFPCPKLRSLFTSIPHSMWFTVVTMVTLGYGDVVPVCHTGRFVAVLSMFLGSVLTAMPIAIVGAYYTSIVAAKRARKASVNAEAKFGHQRGGDSRRSNRDEVLEDDDDDDENGPSLLIQPNNKLDASSSGKQQQPMMDPLQDKELRKQRRKSKKIGGTSALLFDELNDSKGPPTICDSDTWPEHSTMAERIFKGMERYNIAFDLLRPPVPLLEKLDMLISHEYKFVSKFLRSRTGVAMLLSRCSRMSDVSPTTLETSEVVVSRSDTSSSSSRPLVGDNHRMCLELLQAPDIHDLPKTVSLCNQASFIVGCGDGGGGKHGHGGCWGSGGDPFLPKNPDFSLCLNPTVTKGQLPTQLFRCLVNYQRKSVSVLGMFPAVVLLNGKPLSNRIPTRLLVGDVLLIREGVAGSHRELSYQYSWGGMIPKEAINNNNNKNAAKVSSTTRKGSPHRDAGGSGMFSQQQTLMMGKSEPAASTTGGDERKRGIRMNNQQQQQQQQQQQRNTNGTLIVPSLQLSSGVGYDDDDANNHYDDDGSGGGGVVTVEVYEDMTIRPSLHFSAFTPTTSTTQRGGNLLSGGSPRGPPPSRTSLSRAEFEDL